MPIVISGPPLARGSIVTFTYHGKVVHDKFPQILVLHENWEGKVHGINLNNLSDNELNYLKAVVNPTFANEMIQKDPALAMELQRLPKVLDIKSPYDFYVRFIKGFIKRYDSYRQYSREKMQNIRIVKSREEFVGTEPGRFSDFVAKTKTVRGKVPAAEYGREEFDKEYGKSSFEKSYQQTMDRILGRKK